MKLTSIKSTNSTPDMPSDLVGKFLYNENDCKTLTDFLMKFEYESREDIERSIKVLCMAIVNDKYLTNKQTQQACPQYKIVHQRFVDILRSQGQCDRFPYLRASELWHGEYGRKMLNRRTTRLLEDYQPNGMEYSMVCGRLMDVYGISFADIRKLTYFVQQVRAGEAFPPSLRRMLYLWGERKKTGKTTTASCLVTILNGDTLSNIAQYSTTLTNEMQIRAFAVPLIATCNVALMDECFYADMGKTYSDFKRFITSTNGRARLPYGQEFEWKGCPNYVATSNDPLKTFIKDWDDRRYLSVHFDHQPQQMSIDEVYDLWLSFCRNVPEVCDWREATAEIEGMSEETGERMERSEEFAIELQQPEFTDTVMKMTAAVSRFAARNKITLKFFVDYFAQTIGAAEAQKRRGEIEKAVVRVFGERYSTSNYWLLPDLQTKVHEMIYNTPETERVENTEKLPF